MRSDAELIDRAMSIARELGGVFVSPELAERIIAICERNDDAMSPYYACGCHVIMGHIPHCIVTILRESIARPIPTF